VRNAADDLSVACSRSEEAIDRLVLAEWLVYLGPPLDGPGGRRSARLPQIRAGNLLGQVLAQLRRDP
jgi:hypothetical protein